MENAGSTPSPQTRPLALPLLRLSALSPNVPGHRFYTRILEKGEKTKYIYAYQIQHTKSNEKIASILTSISKLPGADVMSSLNPGVHVSLHCSGRPLHGKAGEALRQTAPPDSPLPDFLREQQPY